MNYNKVKEILEYSTERSRYNSGFTLYKRNQVMNDYYQVQGDNHIFYGSVLDDYSNKSYTSLITIDTKNRLILDMSCDCLDTISHKSKKQICPHIVAIALKGINSSLQSTDSNNDYEKPIVTTGLIKFSSISNNHFNMGINIEGVNRNEYKDIYKSYKDNKKLHRLKSGQYLDISNKGLEKILKLIDTLGIDIDILNNNVPSSKLIYIDNYIQEENIDNIEGYDYIKKVSKKYKQNDITYTVPKDLNAKLRNYQIEGFEYLSKILSLEFGGILADEMGLGKTIQSITFLLNNKDLNNIVITPTSLIHNWKKEFEKFAPSLNIGFAYGSKEKRHDVLNNYKDYDLILTTYGTYKNDLEIYNSLEFDICIIDEAQNIKNPTSSISKSVKEINSKARFALTGTPMENNLVELWSIFDFIMPNYLGNKKEFESKFMNNDKNRNELKRLIKPFILRRTKKEVIKELPDKIENKYYVELNKDHKIAYVGYLRLINKKINENSEDNITLLSYLTKLRQLSLTPELMVKNYKGDNSKLKILSNIINENKAKKILVFSQFTKVLSIIKERLEEDNINYSYLDGKTNPKDRVKLVDEFNESKDKQVFLISLKAGGTGLNLTSASIVVHFDPWFNPAVEDQASDRAHRIGQKNVVNVIKLIAKDTIEEKVIALQESKKELIDDVIKGNIDNDKVLSKLTKDELINLFE